MISRELQAYKYAKISNPLLRVGLLPQLKGYLAAVGLFEPESFLAPKEADEPGRVVVEFGCVWGGELVTSI